MHRRCPLEWLILHVQPEWMGFESSRLAKILPRLLSRARLESLTTFQRLLVLLSFRLDERKESSRDVLRIMSTLLEHAVVVLDRLSLITLKSDLFGKNEYFRRLACSLCLTDCVLLGTPVLVCSLADDY